MITSGSIHAFYLFDVAQGIDLETLQEMLGPAATLATLQDKSPGPSRVRYLQPPVIVDGAVLGLNEIDGFKLRLKFYDYGVISLMLSRPFSGAWARSRQDRPGPDRKRTARTTRRRVVAIDRRSRHDRAHRATSGLPRRGLRRHCRERFDRPVTATELVEKHSADIAQMLRGERQVLSDQEREEVLRHRLSYLTDDLVVPAYNAAFVYDSEGGSLATLEILEYVNSQLLEFRYHDELLESELGRIYAGLQRRRGNNWFFGRRSTRAVHAVHAVFIDVNELTDRMENVLKLVGDVYAARLFGLAAARLGLDAWKRNVEDKLKTLDDIYRFTVEQNNIARANILELVIVLVLVIEFGFFLADLLK